MMNVLVTGYPKSGNTWMTRLVGELLNSPVVGFWQEPENDEEAVEGKLRCGKARVYKSHQNPADLVLQGASLVIVMIRDPRDVCCSSVRFFGMSRYFQKFPANQWFVVGRLLRLWDSISTDDFRRSRIIRAVCKGDQYVNPWLRLSWSEFYQGVDCRGVILVRYEDLIKDAGKECRRILDLAGVSSENIDINRVVLNQSFKVVKEKFELVGDERRARFMKSGASGDWKGKLSAKELRLIDRCCGATMKRFGYDV